MNDYEVVKSEKFENDTRAIFDDHHREQATNEKIFSRLTNLISTDYFEIPKNYFHNRIVLDAGCGSNANASYAFLALGAKHVYSVDMGIEWQDCAEKKLSAYKDRTTLISGTVLDLPFEDEKFDFVHCAGVLHHTKNSHSGFNELARVTKSGGKTYISIMANGNGVIYQVINFLRNKYKTDNEFKDVIDNLSEERISKNLNWVFDEIGQYEYFDPAEKVFLKKMFDQDFVLTIKDRLQAPTYHDFNFSEEEMVNWYTAKNYTDHKRITRYLTGFQNLRKYLSPFYHHYDNSISKFLFGNGYIQMIGTK